jgi:hypothetical protein
MEVCFAVLDVHFGVLLGVHHGRNGDTEVGDGAPEVCEEALSANPVIKHISTPISHYFLPSHFIVQPPELLLFLLRIMSNA